jgi:tRNA-dihydrouridine synthase
VFRQILVKIGRPEVFVTEFTSVDGICSVGFDKVAERLMFSEAERPIEAQVWGTNPEHFYRAGKIIRDMNFDGIDINMGCPVKEVLKQGGGSALIGEKTLVAEIIKAVKEGSGGMPVSVKTRIGRKKIITEEWVDFLLNQEIAALTIHARTAAEMSKVPAHWEEVQKAVAVRDRMKSRTLIIGNGDVRSRAEAVEKAKTYGADGIMVGRGVFGNPAIFCPGEKQLSYDERMGLLSEHDHLFEQVWKGRKSFAEFRKYIKIYVQEFPGAGELRNKIMMAEGADEIDQLTGD